MTQKLLFEQIKAKRSFLCVGLDIDLDKIHKHLKDQEDQLFQFDKKIIDATNTYAVPYTPTLAFFET